ncbi:hypothetical protein KPH14_000896 [Odynerus spinipes]|uniref:DUF6570 domain-containing protein n=1 Tax=Odynerus spinipes TaxID=1348599 RepID=A0AAD9RCR5_9HYME|nr:hypothetical protein KPH14_000896 [Odynerus spinipes]
MNADLQMDAQPSTSRIDADLQMDAQPSTSRIDAAHLSLDTSFKKDLKCSNQNFEELLKTVDKDVDITSVVICKCCNQSLSRKHIPNLAKFNGFKYPEMPPNLPPLDLVSERLISPQIPFMQIRRLRHAHGQYGILGQIINVPICVNTMVKQLPRNIDDDHCINVHIKKKLIHKSSYLSGLVKKRCIKAWLQYLITTPLYLFYDITIDESSFIQNNVTVTIPRDEMSEDIPFEDSLTA